MLRGSFWKAEAKMLTCIRKEINTFLPKMATAKESNKCRKEKKQKKEHARRIQSYWRKQRAVSLWARDWGLALVPAPLTDCALQMSTDTALVSVSKDAEFICQNTMLFLCQRLRMIYKVFTSLKLEFRNGKSLYFCIKKSFNWITTRDTFTKLCKCPTPFTSTHYPPDMSPVSLLLSPLPSLQSTSVADICLSPLFSF